MSIRRAAKRYELLPQAVARGASEQRTATNRKRSDVYHRKQRASLPHPGRTRIVRLLRRANNGNVPGHGVGGVPGNGLGFGLPSLGFKHNHRAMHTPVGGKNIGGSHSGAPAVKLKSAPFFKPAKPMPVRKIKSNFGSKQPKPMTSTPLPRLGSAPTTRPKFARDRYNP